MRNQRTRFVPNKEKSAWKSTKTLPWLGIPVDLNKQCVYVSKERISNVLEAITHITNYP